MEIRCEHDGKAAGDAVVITRGTAALRTSSFVFSAFFRPLAAQVAGLSQVGCVLGVLFGFICDLGPFGQVLIAHVPILSPIPPGVPLEFTTVLTSVCGVVCGASSASGIYSHVRSQVFDRPDGSREVFGIYAVPLPQGAFRLSTRNRRANWRRSP